MNHQLKFSFTKLPKNFSFLCRVNMSETQSRSLVDKYVVRDPFTLNVLENALKNKNDQRGIEQILMSLSWLNLRDRLASLFVGKVFYGVYPNSIQMDLIEDVKEVENRFVDFQLDGYSRTFLLGTFIKFHNLQSLSFDSLGDHQIEIHPQTTEILKLAKIKIEKIDYVILFIHHLLSLIDFEEIKKLILEKFSFQQIYEALSLNERKMIHDNFLAYSTSINEFDFFLYDKVK
jgi:hypothetical protein